MDVRRTVLRLGCAVGMAVGLSGIGTGAAEEPVPDVNHPPMPVPEMPVPAGFGPFAPLAYIATFDGRVHAIDTDDGTPLWTTLLSPNRAQGAPAGMFTAYGGAWDYVFVGTSQADDNVFYALDPVSGAVVDTYDHGGVGIGAILGMPAVDYANRRVYFTSLKGSDSGAVWCLDLGPPGPTALTGGGVWSRKWPEIDLGAGTPSVVLHWPGTDSLFVGVKQHTETGDAGGLLHINSATGSIVRGLQLDPLPQAIGAPSLDIGYDLLHVGSEAGILYAVEVPF